MVAGSRERHRISRLDKKYRPDRWVGDHSPQKNPKFHIKGKVRGTKRITLPTVLDIVDANNADQFFKLLAEIRESVLRKQFKRVVLDHAELSSISPEAALLMLAEIQRCRLYCAKRSELTGTYPKAHDVSRLLDNIGFFEALGVKSPELPQVAPGRSYVKVERHNRTLAKVVDSLLDCFSEEISFNVEDRRRLQVALVECMDNVFEHAYAIDSQEPYLFREWWMIGYSDHEDGSISFTFYDQGAGIASTIKQKQEARVLRWLRNWSDGEWLERAIRKPISRHESARRGHGLNKLKKFVDRLGFEGSLRVVANRGDVIFSASGDTEVRNRNEELMGSLIVWTMRPVAPGSIVPKAHFGANDER